MAGTTDHEAVLADFEGWLLEDGRPSHGTAHLTAKLAELRARHRIHEDAERATLRRLAGDLQDTLLGLLPYPRDLAPLGGADPLLGTASVMDDGADPPSTERDSCQTHRKQRIPAPSR